MTDRQFAAITGGPNAVGLKLVRKFVANGYDVLLTAEGSRTR